MNAIELKDVFRVHSTPEGDAAALQGLSLRVADGEVVTVLGPSGSGKSTLLRLLAGLERPSAGLVRVLRRRSGEAAGAPARAVPLVAARLRRPALRPRARARALRTGARRSAARACTDRRGAERLRRADELLERVGLGDVRDRRPTELSGGEQQRVALCAALAHRPKVFLADEPTGRARRRDRRAGVRRDGRARARAPLHDGDRQPRPGVGADRRPDRAHPRRARLGGVVARGRARSDAIVVGRGGWLRLPEELLLRAGIGAHATATLRGRHDRRRARRAGAWRPNSVPDSRRCPTPSARGRRRRVGARGLHKRYGETACSTAGRRVPRRPAARGGRPVGLGQDDAAAPARRARASGRGRGRRSTGSS